MIRLLFSGIVFCLIQWPVCAQPAAAPAKKPVPVIFDTDIGPDYDDVGALAVLHALADSGQCRILATIASNRPPHVAAVLDVLNTYFNRPDIPIGVVRGKAMQIGASQKWDSLLVSRYPHDLTTNDKAQDAVNLYRKILASQPDKSVTIVTVGFLTNMSNLLNSSPDEYSGLNGAALVKQKVKLLVSMAARFDGEFGTFKEFNVKMDASASKNAFDNWPTEIIFSGFEIGYKIFTGLPIANSAIQNSPVKDVFAWSIPLDPQDKNGRMSWDETAALVAVKGYGKYFTIVPGRMVCNDDGSNDWDRKGKGHYYLVQKMPLPQITDELNRLIMHQPRK